MEARISQKATRKNAINVSVILWVQSAGSYFLFKFISSSNNKVMKGLVLEPNKRLKSIKYDSIINR